MRQRDAHQSAPLLMGGCVERIAAMPAKHRKNVPSASATSFRVVSMTRPSV